MPAAPVVTLKEGQLKGKTSTNYVGETFYSFQGIPYAKPPIGELRFKAPEPIGPWSGVLDATKEGPECPSKHMILGYTVGQEDNCLTLNVYTRQLSGEKTAPKPVMLYIYGGGYVQGSNKTEIHGPDYLMMEDIVLVVINYRLGLFGFLSIDDDSLDVPGNAGLKDQVLALKWVQQNIKAFNGDPNNVTVFGESAGAGSVHFLVLSPLCKGLFHKAIIQSGSALNYWSYGTKGLDDVRSQLKYSSTDDKETLEYLRTVSAQKLVNVCHNAKEAILPAEKRLYGPVVEATSPNAFISDTPLNILKSGNYNKVPMIMGFTSQEGFLYEICRKLRPEAKLQPDCDGEISHVIVPKEDEKQRRKMGEQVKKYFFGDEEVSEENIEKTIQMKTDTMFVYDIYRSIKLHLKTSDQPLYLYRMTVETSLNMYKKVCTVKWLNSYFVTLILLKLMNNGLSNSFLLKVASKFSTKDIRGVAHADDLSYLWKMFWNPKIAQDSLEEISIKRFVRMWTNFARYGFPTPSENGVDSLLNVQWIPTANPDLNLLDIGVELSMMKNPDNERMRFWDNLYSEYTTS